MTMSWAGLENIIVCNHRYRDIEKKLLPFLKGCGYNPAKDITFVPISGLGGHNLKLHSSNSSFADRERSKWYTADQPTLFQILNELPLPERDEKAALRVPLLEGLVQQSR